MTPFASWLAFAWLPTNDGQPYHRTAGDVGGYTAWAVTYHNYAAWEAVHHRPWPRLSQFEHASKDDLATILHAWTWAAVGGDLLPPCVAFVVADAACLSGPGTAAMILQRLVHVDRIDGQVGRITAEAVAACDPANLARSFSAAYRAHDDALGQARFEDGWDRRIGAALDAALALVQQPEPVS